MASVVANLDEALDNIDRYQVEVRKRLELAKLMKQVHAWYAIESSDGTWRFAPSKFIGYAGNNAKAYLVEAHHRDGGSTEAALRNWFVVVPPDTRRGAELNDALRSFLKSHGHSGPRRGARICVLKEVSRATPTPCPLTSGIEFVSIPESAAADRISGVPEFAYRTYWTFSPTVYRNRKSLPTTPIFARRTCVRPWRSARPQASTA